jgi:cytochrome c peroxidase
MHRAIVALLFVACGGSGHLSQAGPGGRSAREAEAAEGGGAASGVTGASAAGQAGAAPVMDDPDPALTTEERAALEQLSPAVLPPPPADASNAWADDPRAALFGQKLFFDTRFAGALLDGDNDGSENALGMKGETGKVSCAGCHVPASGFSDTRTIRHQISLGAGWGMRRSPSLLDVGQSRLLMWDGRRDSLYGQAFGPLESAVEMNSSRLYGAQQVFLNHKADYEAIFGTLPPLDDAERFPPLSAASTGCGKLDRDSTCMTVSRGSPGDGAEFDGMSSADREAVTRVWVNAGKAMGAYQRLLTCGQSRFDAWMQGDSAALDRAEQRGAALFVGKARCVECHTGPYLSDEAFHNVGLQPMLVATVFLDADDPGASVGLTEALADPLNVRGPFSDGDDGRLPSGVASDTWLGAFRTPRLRCVAERPSFMHTGQFLSLSEVVAFFSRGGDHFGFPGRSELTPLELSAREQQDLVAFLRALTGPGPDQALLTAP